MSFFGLFKSREEKIRNVFKNNGKIANLVIEENIEELISIAATNPHVTQNGTNVSSITKDNVNIFFDYIYAGWGLSYIGAKAVKPVISSLKLSEEDKIEILWTMSTGPEKIGTLEELTKCVKKRYGNQDTEFYLKIKQKIDATLRSRETLTGK